MKKSLIALAVAGIVAAPAAFADTTIYGQANLSFDAINNGAKTNSASANNVSSNVSRLGFKGSEDLGDGLSAVYQIEQAIAMDTAALGGSTVRDTFAGLSSGTMGTLIAGTHDTPYKMATRGLDLFGDSVADNRSIMGLAGTHDARLGNVVAYIAPTMSGVTLAVATAAGAEIPVVNSTKASVWSLAALYGAGPINANFGYQTITYGSAGTGDWAGVANDKLTAWKVGGSYTMDALQLNAIYEKTSSSIAGGINSGDTHARTAFYLAGKYNVNANDAVKAAYTSAGKKANVTDTEATQFSVGYDHNLSKHTSVYALYSKISNKGTGAAGQANYTFSQATSAANANGGISSSPSVVSLGMKHSF